MTGSSDEISLYCVGCGVRLVNDWEFCPTCGTRRALVPKLEVESAPASLRAESILGAQVKTLIDEGKLEIAEDVVTTALMASRDIDTLLIAADVFSRRFKVNETADLLEEGLKLAPDNYLLRIRRAEHFGRIGLYPQAFDEIRLARRFLPPGELSIFMYCQELERLFRDRAKGSFVMAPTLPRLPSLPFGRRKRTASPSPEVTDSNGGF